MEKTISVLQADLSKIRTGRASPNLLNTIMVNQYGCEVPLNQVANISTEGATGLVLNVWDKAMVLEVEKAIQESDLGINPVVKGSIVHLAIPPLTEERRKELIKLVHKQGEHAKVAIRNIRRDLNQKLKKDLKRKEITEDEEQTALDKIQKLTDQFIAAVDHTLQQKDKELATI